jgi:hypothetical protein
MERNTEFDLSLEIRYWKERLSKSPGFREENLDELESHLRDSIRELQRLGLSAEEAFSIATRRIGSGTALASEFSKVNGNSVWMDRLLWMLLGWGSVSVMQSLITALPVAAAMPNDLPLWILTLLWVAPIVLSVLAVRSLVRPDGTIPRILSKLLRRPLTLALSFLTIQAFPFAFRAGLARSVGAAAYGRSAFYGNLILLGLWPVVAVLIFILARRRLRPAQA